MPKVLNSIRIRRSIQVESVLTVYHMENYVNLRPRDELYPFWQATFLLSGEGTYHTEEGEYPFHAGEVLFRRPGCSTRIEYPQNGEPVSFTIISFECHSQAMDALPRGPVKLYGEERATLLDLVRTGIRICRPLREGEPLRGFTLREDTPDEVLEFVGVSLERFLIMVSCRLAGHTLLTDESEKSNRFAEHSQTAVMIRQYLEERVCERLSIGELAGHFGLSQTVLMKLYKREYGATVMEDFTRMKVNYAKHQITHSGRNFTEIAEELGYSSQGYFSRVFRRFEGLTPTEYSRMVTKKNY